MTIQKYLEQIVVHLYINFFDNTQQFGFITAKEAKTAKKCPNITAINSAHLKFFFTARNNGTTQP